MFAADGSRLINAAFIPLLQYVLTTATDAAKMATIATMYVNTVPALMDDTGSVALVLPTNRLVGEVRNNPGTGEAIVGEAIQVPGTVPSFGSKTGVLALRMRAVAA